VTQQATPSKGIETHLGLSPQTAWMNFVMQDKALVDGTTVVPQTLRVWSPVLGKYVDMIFGSIDGGNSANKNAFIETRFVREAGGGSHTENHVKMVRVPTAYQVRKKIRHGEGKVTYRVMDGTNPEYFWMGTNVVAEGDALPNGTTLQRLNHKRYSPYTLATVIDGLMEAGHKAEVIDSKTGLPVIDEATGKPLAAEKHLTLAYGVRDDEIESVAGKQFMDPELEKAINDLARSWVIERYDQDGTLHTWHLRIHYIFPAAQTLGSVFAYIFQLNGGLALSKKNILCLDGGQKDLQKLRVSLQGGLNATGGTIGRGAVLFTDTLIEAAKDYHLQLTPAQAHLALKDGYVVLGGDETPLHQVIEAGVRESNIESILGVTLNHIDEAGDAHLLFVGGLACFAQADILNLIGPKGLKRTTQQYFICDSNISAYMNALGLLAYCLFQLKKKKQELDQIPEARQALAQEIRAHEEEERIAEQKQRTQSMMQGRGPYYNNTNR
jgi:hypothetical protein